MRTNLQYRNSSRATTLVELMVAVSVFLIAIIGILYSYLKCLELQDIGRSVSIATQAVRNQMETIKNSTYNTVYTTYNNATFTTTGINGRGVVYVNNTDTSLLQVKVAFCWKQANGRLLGEDSNLNGVLNSGEDTNGNGKIDGYVQITTNIYG
jgi:type II secretory pathway pseudopilin PulG